MGRGAGATGRTATIAACMAFASCISGCSEFSHFGEVSDRLGAGGVAYAMIEQQQPGGAWKRIGRTDGKGAWNIFKHDIRGGGRIRIRKEGYRSVVLTEQDFLQQNLILMAPEDSGEVR